MRIITVPGFLVHSTSLMMPEISLSIARSFLPTTYESCQFPHHLSLLVEAILWPVNGHCFQNIIRQALAVLMICNSPGFEDEFSGQFLKEYHKTDFHLWPSIPLWKNIYLVSKKKTELLEEGVCKGTRNPTNNMQEEKTKQKKNIAICPVLYL